MRERLVLDLDLYTAAARADLAKLGRSNIKGGLLVYSRQKSGTTARVPITPELRALIARTPDISPKFSLTESGMQKEKWRSREDSNPQHPD